MSRFALNVYAHVAVILGSLLALMWGIDFRWALTIITVTGLSLIMNAHTHSREMACGMEIYTVYEGTGPRCVLKQGHAGYCTSYDGLRRTTALPLDRYEYENRLNEARRKAREKARAEIAESTELLNDSINSIDAIVDSIKRDKSRNESS